jgi:hypothetical protein
MRYEKELRRIRNELGENTRVIDLTPNKQIVINLDDFGQSVGPQLSSLNQSTVIQDANQLNSHINSMILRAGPQSHQGESILESELEKRKSVINHSLL